MNNPFDQISGQIIVKGRVYSAKEVIRGLLEQGIAITESSEGLKIGFKLFSPQATSTQTILEENGVINCPFIPYISQIAKQLEDLALRLNFQPDGTDSNDISQTSSPFISPPLENPTPSAFSPFDAASLQSNKENEKEKFFSSSSSFFDNRQKCPSCGATIPQNAFFCNKCGNHVRSG